MERADFELLARELFVVIRGRKTQAQTNQLLRRDYNKASKWETGSGSIYWRDLVALCDACGSDLKGALAEHLGFHCDPSATQLVLKDLAAGMTPKEICFRLKCSRASWSRWAGGRTDAPLAIALHLLWVTGRLHTFLAAISNPDSVPSIRRFHRKQVSARTVFAAYPEAAVLLCYLETKQFRALDVHQAGVFAAA